MRSFACTMSYVVWQSAYPGSNLSWGLWGFLTVSFCLALMQDLKGLVPKE